MRRGLDEFPWHGNGRQPYNGRVMEKTSQHTGQPKIRALPGFAYKLMLLGATIIWGFAFVVMKDAVDVLPPAQLIGVRFLLTGLLMAVRNRTVCSRRKRDQEERPCRNRHELRICIRCTDRYGR